MPAAKMPNFQQRSLALVAMRESTAHVVNGLGISEGPLGPWAPIDDVDSGHVEGLSSVEKRELIVLQ